MKYIKKYNQLNSLNESGYYPYHYKLSDAEIEKTYKYFFYHVFPQERYKLMNEIIKESIEYTDFMNFYNKLYYPDQFVMRPLLMIYYANSFASLTSLFQVDVFNNQPNYQDVNRHGWAHVLKDDFNNLYTNNDVFTGKERHGYPCYEYKLGLTITDNWTIDDKKIKMEDIIKSLNGVNSLGLSYQNPIKIQIIKFLQETIKRFAKHMDVELSIFLSLRGPNHLRKNCFEFEVRLIDLDFTPPPFNIIKIDEV